MLKEEKKHFLMPGFVIIGYCVLVIAAIFIQNQILFIFLFCLILFNFFINEYFYTITLRPLINKVGYLKGKIDMFNIIKKKLR